MKRLLAAAAVAVVGLTVGTQAAPLGPFLSPAAPPSVTLVADGCGPFGHRSHFGYCKGDGYGPGPRYFGGPPPGFGGPFGYGPPRFYGRRCFVRDTYYGPRRVCE